MMFRVTWSLHIDVRFEQSYFGARTATGVAVSAAVFVAVSTIREHALDITR